MLREPIASELAARFITINSLIYSQQSVSVYDGYYQSFHAAIKVISSPPSLTNSTYDKEAMAMLNLSHPNILKLYDFMRIELPDIVYNMLVTEWCDKDIGKDIQQRKKNLYPYTEEDLMLMIRSIGNALCYMQHAGIAHRDIKPANIFLSNKKEFKLADFGSARFSPWRDQTMTIAGTPVYLSPALRLAFVQSTSKVHHDVYKSDVYSLGLTLLHMALLQFPMQCTNFHGSQDTMQGTIASLSYSNYLKDLMKWMLEEDESRRCDFMQLDEYLNRPVVIEEKVEIMHQFTNLAGAKTTSNWETPPYPTQPPPPYPNSTHPFIQSPQAKAASYMPQLPNTTTCLFCKSTSPSTHINSWEPISLFCKPNQHIFCSPSCFAQFAQGHRSKADMVCPACNEPIPREVYDQHFPNRADDTGIEEPAESFELGTAPAMQQDFQTEILMVARHERVRPGEEIEIFRVGPEMKHRKSASIHPEPNKINSNKRKSKCCSIF